jgi:hypothetical protein
MINKKHCFDGGGIKMENDDNNDNNYFILCGQCGKIIQKDEFYVSLVVNKEKQVVNEETDKFEIEIELSEAIATYCEECNPFKLKGG